MIENTYAITHDGQLLTLNDGELIMDEVKPQFEVPVLMRPWVSKVATALLTAAIVFLVTWLNTKGIEVALPPIEAEVKALRQEVQEMRHEYTIASKAK
jgi:hypothetical protein